MNGPLRVGVMGLRVGVMHAKAAQNEPSVTLAGVADIVAKKRVPFANAPIQAGDYHELLQHDDIDAVVVALPNYMHAEACIAAFEAGKHVLCEKPLARSVAEGQQIIDAANKAGRVLMMGFNQRFTTHIEWINRQLAVYPPGQIYFARCGWLRRWRKPRLDRLWHHEKALAGGGPLIDIGVHVIDLALYLLGFPRPVEVMAQVATPYSKHDATHDTEDFVAAQIRFESGATLQIQVQEEGHIRGEDVFVEFQGINSGALYRPAELPRIFLGRDELQSDLVAPDSLSGDPYVGRQERLLKRFAETIAGTASGTCTGAESLAVLRIVEAIYRSGAAGRAVRLDE